jgi:hypothetical protein
MGIKLALAAMVGIAMGAVANLAYGSLPVLPATAASPAPSGGVIVTASGPVPDDFAKFLAGFYFTRPPVENVTIQKNNETFTFPLAGGTGVLTGTFTVWGTSTYTDPATKAACTGTRHYDDTFSGDFDPATGKLTFTGTQHEVSVNPCLPAGNVDKSSPTTLGTASYDGKVVSFLDKNGKTVYTLPATESGGGPPSGCIVQGKLNDLFNRNPLVGVHVQLHYGTHNIDRATDSKGEYKFPEIPSGKTASFDPANDDIGLTITVEDWAHQPSRFQVTVDGELATISSQWKLKTGQDCTRSVHQDSDLAQFNVSENGNAHWWDLVEIYRDIQTAWGLADDLGVNITYGLPLPIHAYCTKAQYLCDSGQVAFARVSTTREQVASPFISLKAPVSVISPSLATTIYHEFGHYFMAATFGADATAGDADPHAGYANPTSTSSWNEGWANFYAVMVKYYKTTSASPTLWYFVAGGALDVKNHYRPWDGGGGVEEFSVAGALLDVEDGPSSTPAAATPKSYDVSCCTTNSAGNLAVGTVTNTTASKDWSYETMASVTWSGGSAQVPLDPPDIAGGAKGTFYVPLPAGVTAGQLMATAREGRPAPAGSDDGVEVPLKQLWPILAGCTTNPSRQPHIYTVSDLYACLKKSLDPSASAGTLTPLDHIFIDHGLFQDRDGSHNYQTGEAIGVTSHPGADPRPDARPLPTERVKVDSGVAGARVIVEEQFPAPNQGLSFGYVVKADPQGYYNVTVPPPGTSATVAVIAAADGYEPAVEGSIAEGDFWKQANASPKTPFLTFSVKLKAVATVAPHASSVLLPVLLAGIGVVLVVGLAIVIQRRRRFATAAAGSLPSLSPVTPAWTPTHRAPAAGLDCREVPDPTASVVARLDPWLSVRVVEQRGDWAHIACSNGWTAWVDGTRLADGRHPEPTAPTTGFGVRRAWIATHCAPADGLDTWPSPDANGPKGPRLDPRLDVEVDERRGDWAHVVCANGWSAWVDGRRLETRAM